MFGFGNINIQSYDELLEYFSEEQILEHYYGKIMLDQRFSYRTDDKTPSAIFYEKNGRIRFKDFGLNEPSMDVLDFLRFDQVQFHKMHYGKMLDKIYADLFEHGYEVGNIQPLKKSFKVPINIKYGFKFKDFELEFWKSRKILLETLRVFEVTRCIEWKFGDRLWHGSVPGDPMFTYIFDKERLSVQGYRPIPKVPTEDIKKEKFRTKNCSGILMGENFLPDTGDVVFMTKSMKDIMSIYQSGFPAVSGFGENHSITENQLKDLRRRFKHVVTFYDNDQTGILAAKTLLQRHGLPYVWIPKTLRPLKDPNDLICKLNQDALTKFLTSFIDKHLIPF